MANTGYVIVTERDTNPLSQTYNTTRTRTYEDLVLCPIDGSYKIRYVRHKPNIWTRGTRSCSSGSVGVIQQSDIDPIEGLGFSMTKLEIGSCVNTIAAEAVKNRTSLQGLYISSTVNSIGDRAFYGCDSLNIITIYATTPPVLGTLVFYGSSCPIYVPVESVSAYQAAWSEYANRIRPIEE